MTSKEIETEKKYDHNNEKGFVGEVEFEGHSGRRQTSWAFINCEGRKFAQWINRATEHDDGAIGDEKGRAGREKGNPRDEG